MIYIQWDLALCKGIISFSYHLASKISEEEEVLEQHKIPKGHMLW